MHVAAIACQVVQSEPGWNLWGLRISRGHVHACLQVCWALLLKGGKTAKSICDGVIPPEGKSKANILMRCGAFVILCCCKVGWAPHRSGAWVLCLCSSKVRKELPRQAADAGHRGALLCWHTLTAAAWAAPSALGARARYPQWFLLGEDGLMQFCIWGQSLRKGANLQEAALIGLEGCCCSVSLVVCVSRSQSGGGWSHLCRLQV